MQIAIIGAGGVGGYLAAKFTAAGQDVSVLARGAQLAAIRKDGLRLFDPEGDLTATPALVTDDAGALGQPDLIVVTVKAHQLADTLAQIAPAVGPGTRVLPIQNGVDAPEMLAQAFGRERALIGVARIFANITGPGTITRYGTARGFTIGTIDGRQGAVRDLIEAFRGAGIIAPDHPDVRIDLWAKFVLFNGTSSVNAAARARFGVLRALPETAALVRRVMDETLALGRASGVPLPPRIVDDCMRVFHESLPEDGRTSTAHDLDEGRALEIDHISGAVARRGRALDIDVTASETLYAVLRPWRDGPPA